MTQSDVEPLPRCCERHDDWRTLAEHLVDDFTELKAGDVVREIDRAKQATGQFGLAEAEQLQVTELMARHQLMLLSGRLSDVARLDPERHLRAGSAT
jgi:hypothetical protein